MPQKIYWEESAFIADGEYASYYQYQLCAGDVLLSLDRPVISSGFKVAQVREEDLPALLVQRVGRFIINKSELLADYLYAYLQTPAFIQKVVGHDPSFIRQTDCII